MSDGQLEVTVVAVSLRWTMTVMHGWTLDHRELVRQISRCGERCSVFQFNGGTWTLCYRYGRTESGCGRLGYHYVHLRKVYGECRRPFRSSVHVEGGGRGRIVTELSEDRRFLPNDYRTWPPVAPMCIWVKGEEKILEAVPEFSRNEIPQMHVVLQLDVPTPGYVESVATQTECSLPEGFELSCMESLSEDFARLMVRGSDPDVELRCADITIAVHGAVIGARSPVLAAMLASDMIEGRTKIVRIPGMTPDVFRHFLRYIYSGKLTRELTFEVALALYEYADQYAVLGLARRCSRYLVEHLSDQNACDVLVVADAHSDGGFVEEVVDYMVDGKIPWTSDHWTSFCDEHPTLARKVLNRFCNGV